MSEVINKHSRMPRKLSRRTLKRREEQALAGANLAILNEVNPHAVIERYLAGEKIRDMAQGYGVKPVSLYHFLLKHVPDEWLAAQKAAAFAKKEAGEDGLDDSKDALDVAIAREKLRAGQWDLERVMRKEYGRDEANITINVVDLGERLRRSKERLANPQVIEKQIGSTPSTSLASAHEIQDAELVGQSHVQPQQYDNEAAHNDPIKVAPSCG